MTSENKNTVTLTNNQTGETLELPILKGSVGPDVIDIRSIYSNMGLFTFDPGFGMTGSCKSSLTYIDGEEGQLLHSGYAIDELAEKSDFLEVAYLLLHGELPSAPEKHEFDYAITHHTMVHEQLMSFFRGFRRDAHPMAILCGVTGALSAFYHDSTDINDPQQRMIASRRLIAKMPTLAAMAFKYSNGQPFNYPRNNLSYAENFRICASLCRPKIMRSIQCWLMPWIRFSSSTPITNRMPRLLLSGLPVLLAPTPLPVSPPVLPRCWGLPMVAPMRLCSTCCPKSVTAAIPEYIKKARDKDDPFRLFGFGHRVYKNFDPRAKVMRDSCHKVLNDLGIKDEPLLTLALELEEIALKDEYFIEKKLYPNVDFYSGIILKAMGFPPRCSPFCLLLRGQSAGFRNGKR